ncbi:GntR family transcriptional regulator [Sporomusa acidovorans]|uniref:HTH-type transcriptional regulator McbR n=1 Tax=Sporomusa acidovorans (strain ATCC 49682 / DSM 3132 / Mol) TaxID=1123286 RepID=A0ABZ3IXV7_SPOA4|nr:GntR family transcriptional regulator [Sporomusa acidovorans]OZC15836.1 HTH-type transcriptional regulator McbR [Sporomusa acidovorans DSM 3132]SDF29872.1 transcriptional regulator, GntR family [Sporomusa acidovorans]
MEKNINNTKNKRISKKEQAYEYIRTNILNGTFGPGYRIVIDNIKKELALSSIPVREAIQQLEAENLIQVIPYSGAVVKMVDEKDYEENQTLLAILDGAATAMASEHLTQADFQRLEQLNSDMAVALDELQLEEFGELNAEFHKMIYHRCGNSYLINTLANVWQRMMQIRKSIYTLVPYRGKESIHEHAALIEMFKAHEPLEKIEKFSRKHKMEMLEAVKKVIQNKKKKNKIL